MTSHYRKKRFLFILEIPLKACNVKLIFSHFYRKRQAAIEESKRQGAENRQIHENMRREREASMSPQDMPIEMQNF